MIVEPETSGAHVPEWSTSMTRRTIPRSRRGLPAKLRSPAAGRSDQWPGNPATNPAARPGPAAGAHPDQVHSRDGRPVRHRQDNRQDGNPLGRFLRRHRGGTHAGCQREDDRRLRPASRRYLLPYLPDHAAWSASRRRRAHPRTQPRETSSRPGKTPMPRQVTP